jgi:hypothetical protein
MRRSRFCRTMNKKKILFFEKKKQKTFANGVWRGVQRGGADVADKAQKFFGSFF